MISYNLSRNAVLFIVMILSSHMISAIKLKNTLNLSNPKQTLNEKECTPYSEMLKNIINPEKALSLMNTDDTHITSYCQDFIKIDLLLKSLEKQKNAEKIIQIVYAQKTSSAEKLKKNLLKDNPKYLIEDLLLLFKKIDYKEFKELEKKFEKKYQVEEIKKNCKYNLKILVKTNT